MVQTVVLIVYPVHVFLVLGRNNVVGSRHNLLTSKGVTAIFAAAVSLPDSAGEATFDGVGLLIGDRLDGLNTFVEGDSDGHL